MGLTLPKYLLFSNINTNVKIFNKLYLVDSGKRRFIAEELSKLGKGNITSKIFSYRELCDATQNFHPSNMIGEGGFGRVYKGRIKSTNQVLLQLLFLNIMLRKKPIQVVK